MTHPELPQGVSLKPSPIFTRIERTCWSVPGLPAPTLRRRAQSRALAWAHQAVGPVSCLTRALRIAAR
jgi:hypothetical protein